MRMEKPTQSLPYHRQKALGTSPKGVEKFQNPTIAATASRPYRVSLRISHIGKYVAQSKRRIVWRFGLWHPCTHQEQLHMHAEEHEVTLVWSVRRGKTRLFWNGAEISHYFPRKESPKAPDTVQFSWQSSSGVTLQIVAHVNSTPDNVEQYGLYVDGLGFKTLPVLPQLLEWYGVVAAAAAETQANPDERDAKSVPAVKDGSWKDGSDEALQEREQQQQRERRRRRRLCRAGLDTGQISLEEFDELRSDLNELVESLRKALADAIPVTEAKQILSRAIVNILSKDDLDSDSSHEDSLSVDFESKLDPTETEADLLFETIEWLMANTQRPDFDLAKLDFLEKEIESVVCHVRCDRLDPYDASRAVIPVAALLGIELKQPFERRTVVLKGLDSGATTHDVVHTMAQFGELEGAAVSRSYAGFAICRYTSESAALSACEAGLEEKIAIGGATPEIYELLLVPLPIRRDVSSGSYSMASDVASPFESDDDERRRSPLQELVLKDDESTADMSDLESSSRRGSLSLSDHDLAQMSAPNMGEQHGFLQMDLEGKTHRRQSATILSTGDSFSFITSSNSLSAQTSVSD